MPTWDEIGQGRTVRIHYRGGSHEHTIYPSTTALSVGVGDEVITIEFIEGFPTS